MALLAIRYWKSAASGNSVLGTVEGHRSTVTTPFTGKLSTVLVRRHEQVRRGQSVAQIQAADPGIQLDLLRLESDAAQLRHDPSVAQRNALDYEQLRLNTEKLRTEIVTAKINAERAVMEQRRSQALFDAGIQSADLHETVIKGLQVWQSELEAKSKQLAEAEIGLTRLRALGDPTWTNQFEGDLPYHQELQVRLELAREITAPVTLVAPIDGVVTYVCQPDEVIREGDPVVVIEAQSGFHVVAYLRQPLPFNPQPGGRIEIATRQSPVLRAQSSIRQIGPQYQIITNALTLLRPGQMVDVGLPIIVDLPPGLPVRPGEVVQILWLD